MDILEPLQLVRRDGSTTSLADMGEADFVGVYFAAQWCSGCREFTPQLRSVFHELKRSQRRFEVLVVSLDRTEPNMMELLNDTNMYWPAVPFNGDARMQLKERFSVKRLPTLIILDRQGALVCPFGRDYIEHEGADIWDRWISKQSRKQSETTDG